MHGYDITAIADDSSHSERSSHAEASSTVDTSAEFESVVDLEQSARAGLNKRPKVGCFPMHDGEGKERQSRMQRAAALSQLRDTQGSEPLHPRVASSACAASSGSDAQETSGSRKRFFAVRPEHADAEPRKALCKRKALCNSSDDANEVSGYIDTAPADAALVGHCLHKDYFSQIEQAIHKSLHRIVRMLFVLASPFSDTLQNHAGASGITWALASANPAAFFTAHDSILSPFQASLCDPLALMFSS